MIHNFKNNIRVVFPACEGAGANSSRKATAEDYFTVRKRMQTHGGVLFIRNVIIRNQCTVQPFIYSLVSVTLLPTSAASVSDHKVVSVSGRFFFDSLFPALF